MGNSESAEDKITTEFYSSLSEALRMLDEDCWKLRVEVFQTYCQLIKASDASIICHSSVMLQSMAEWDLL